MLRREIDEFLKGDMVALQRPIAIALDPPV
jgi:hypothetical protein